jgi:hypothetical protein
MNRRADGAGDSVEHSVSLLGIRQNAHELGLPVNAELSEYALEVNPHGAGSDSETRRRGAAPVAFADFEGNGDLGRSQTEFFPQVRRTHLSFPF